MTLLMEVVPVQQAGTEPTGVGQRTVDWLLSSFDRVQDAAEEVAVSTAGMEEHDDQERYAAVPVPAIRRRGRFPAREASHDRGDHADHEQVGGHSGG